MDTPAIGSGATVYIGSDSYGCTVVEVDRDGVVTVQFDTATPGEGHSYYTHQVWVHSPNAEGQKESFRYNIAAKTWRQVMKNEKTSRWRTVPHGCPVEFGERNSYTDPSF